MLQRQDIPNKKWLKKALLEWLEKNATAKMIEFDPKKKYYKDDLWNLIKPAIGNFHNFHTFFKGHFKFENVHILDHPNEKYEVEQIFKKYGVRVCRLVPYHPEINAIGIELNILLAVENSDFT